MPAVEGSAVRVRSMGIERLKCPEHLQRRLTQVGGTNRYGQPHFKLAWAQTATTRQGGQWELESGEAFTGYRDVYLGDGLPHWMLLQWADAGKSIGMPHLPPESDTRWYIDNKCPKTGLSLLGEYPYRGSYQIALTLTAKFVHDGKLHIRAFPLSTEIVEMMVPIIKAALEVSAEAKLRYLKEQQEKEDEQYAKTIEDIYNDVKLPTSAHSSQWITDKQRSIENSFNAALIQRMHRDRKFQSQHRA